MSGSDRRHWGDIISSGALASLTGGFAAGFAGNVGLLLPFIFRTGLTNPGELLMLPLYLLSASAWGFAVGLLGLYVSLPFASAGLVIMALAERRSPIFRSRLWWCIPGLALMPLGILLLPIAAPIILEVAGNGDTLGLVDGLAIGIPAALAGALVARRTWHALTPARAGLDKEPEGLTSHAA
jgi:hypothetical protein